MGFDVAAYAEKFKKERHNGGKQKFDVAEYARKIEVESGRVNLAKDFSDLHSLYNTAIEADTERFKTEVYRADTEDYMSSVWQNKSAYESAAYALQDKLDKYGKYYGTEFVTNASDFITSSLKDYGTLYDRSIADNEYFSSFGSEEKYNEYLDAIKADEDMLKYDSVAGQADIDRLQEIVDAYDRVQQPTFSNSDRGHSAQAKMDAYNSQMAEIKQRYGVSYEDAKAQISAKRAYHTRALRKQEKSDIVSSATADPEFDLYVAVGKQNTSDNIIKYGNNKDALNEYLKTAQGFDVEGSFTYIPKWVKIAEKISEDEYNRYAYFIGKEDYETASRYLDLAEEDMNSRAAANLVSVIGDSDVSKYFFAALAGLDQFGSGIESLFSDKDYIPATSIQMASGAIRDSLAGDEDGFKIFGSSLGQIAYDAINTTSNMLPSILISTIPVVGSAVGSVTLGASAAGHAKAEMLNLGYSKSQANTYGLLVGASEAGLQYFLGGIGKLGGKAASGLTGKILSKVDNALARVAITIGANAISEGIEEGLQTVLETWFKEIATDVDWESPNIDEILYSSLLGAISSIGFEGVGATASGIKTARLGSNIKKVDGGVAKLKEIGALKSPDTAANRLAGKVNDKSSSYQVGRLATEIGETIVPGSENFTNNSKYYELMRLADEVANGKDAKANADESTPDVSDNVRKAVQKVSDKAFSDVNANANKHTLEKSTKDAIGQYVKTASARLGFDIKNIAVNSGSIKSNVDVSNKVSEDGKTTKVSTGDEVVIDKGNAIKEVKTENGERVVYYNTDKGVVADNDITYANEDDGILYESFSDINPAIANAAISNYDGELTVKAYVDGMREGILLYGAHNFQSVEKDISTNSDFASLSKEDQAFALKLGREYAKMNTDAAEKAIKAAAEKAKAEGQKAGEQRDRGNVTFEDGVKPKTMEQRRAVVLAKSLAKALGINIVFYDARYTTDKHGKGANGFFDPKTNSIHLDMQNGMDDTHTIVFTMSHELVHFIKKWSPAKFKVFADFLMEQYAAHGVSTSTLLAEKMAQIEETNADKAYEELIADACERMLLDSNAVMKLMELRKTDLELFEKIKLHILELLNRIRAAFKGVDPNTEEGKALQKMEDVLDKLHAMFEDAAVDAAQNYQTIGNRDLSEFSDAVGTDGEPLLQYKAFKADENTYRSMLTKWGKMTDEQISNLFDTVNEAMDLIVENLEVLDYAWESDIDDRAFFPIKQNSDKLYKVSLDFSTLCRKRILQQMVVAQLQEALNQPLTKEEGIAIRDALIALQEEGRQIEVACALCYVESARMKSPEQIKKFLNNREAVIKEFFAGKSGGSMKEKIASAETAAREKLYKENPSGIKGKDGSTMLDPREAKLNQLPKKYADEIRAAKKAAKESYVPTAEEQRVIDAAKGMSVSDFTTPEGLEKLAKTYPSLFDAYTSYVRNATKSKGIEKDTWWRAGDSQNIGDVLIANMNKENGLRSQSWSDFQVVHILDYIAATIELATREAKEQAYSKVPDYVELMGKTGVMINMSLIPTAKFDGKLDYDSVEGMAYKRAIDLRDKYPETAGTICIGIQNEQIRMLLADMTIDYVIPYHKSGMSAVTRKSMRIPTWDNYEDYQGEGKLSREDALKNANRYGVELLDESDPNYQKGTSFSEWFDLKEAQQIAEIKNAKPSDNAKYKKYGVMYGGYMAMQNAAQNYLKLCAERGLSPKFSHEKADFTSEENYWKLLIDRKMVNNKTGEIIEQKPIKPIFEQSEVMRILNDELARYPRVKEDQEYAIRKVTEKFLSGEVKGGMSAEAIAKVMKKPVDNVTKVNIIEAADDGVKKQLKKTTDADYLDAVNRGDMVAAQRMVEEAARDAGYGSPKLYHGTNAFGFTTIDNTAPGADGYSFWAANKEATSATYTNYGRVRSVSSELSNEDIGHMIEEIDNDIDDEIDNFRSLIDRTFSEWYFGQSGNESLRGAFDGSNFEQGYGDGVYDVFIEYIADAYYQYQDSLDEAYSDFDEWLDESEEGKKLIDSIIALEGLRKKQHELDTEDLGGIYQLYANTSNMYELDGNGNSWNNLKPSGLPNISRPYKTRDVAEWAKNNGYNGVIFRNIVDSGQYGYAEASDVYAFFNPHAQVKSADPVTYDDNGNIIPLSKRFNSKNDDIRYQRKQHQTANDTESGLTRMYESGEIDLNEWAVRMLGVYQRKNGGDIFDIARTTKEDASTTPKLREAQLMTIGKGDSKFYESLQKANIFDEKFKKTVESDDFVKHYQEITNKGTLSAAADRLVQYGAGYTKHFVDELDPRSASPIDTAAGFILLGHYQANGDYAGALRVAQKLRQIATAAGQGLQAFGILGRLDPSMMQAFAQSELDEAFKKMVIGKTKAWIAANKDRFNLTDEEAEAIRTKTLEAAMLPERSRDKAIKMAEIAKIIQDKLPPEKGQGFKAWQRTSLLLNPKTILRNIIGNVGASAMFFASDVFGTPLDYFISKKTGQRTTGIGVANAKDSIKAFGRGAYEAYDDYKRGIKTRAEELDRFDIKGRGKAFDENTWYGGVSKALNAADRLTSFLLEVGDRPFYEMHFMNSLNNLMRLNKASVPTEDMIQMAQREALERTWQDSNAVVSMVSKFKNGLNYLSIGGYGLGDVIIKFVKTPANITKAIYDFSPAALISVAANGKALVTSLQNGQFTPTIQKKFVDSAGKAIAGTMLYVIAAALFSKGLLTGDDDDDKDVAAFEKYVQGIPSYSIKIGDKWYSYDWAQPLGAAPAIVANFMESRSQGDDDLSKSITEAFRAGGEVLFNQSFMKSLQEIFADEDIFGNLIPAVLSDMSSNVPTLLSQIATLTDDKRRTTYDATSEWNTAVNKVKARIPFLRQQLDVEIDVLGRETPNAQNNVWDAFFNPANTYTDTSTEVTDHLYELYKATGDDSIIPKKADTKVTIKGDSYKMNTEERNAYQRAIGETSHTIISSLIDNDVYLSLSDEEKASVIGRVYEYSTAVAKSGQEKSMSFDVLSGIDIFLTEEEYEAMSDEERKEVLDEYLFKSYSDIAGFESEQKATWFVNKSAPLAFNNALVAGDTKRAKSILKSVEDSIKSFGLSRKDTDEMVKEAKSSIKTKVTTYWKEYYLRAYKNKNEAEMRKVREMLYNTGLYGSAVDVVKLCRGWITGK